METLNPIQLEILKLFNNHHSEKELLEIKRILAQYLAKNIVEEADAEYNKRNTSSESANSWPDEHYRSKKG
jgi:hypothetical protein